MEDIMLDKDGNFVAAADGDMETVQDMDCLVQDVSHMLLTYPGDLWAHTDYGIGIQRYIQAEDTELYRLEISQLIRLGLAQDERIDADSIEVDIESLERDHITVKISFQASDGAFDSDESTAATASIVVSITANGLTVEGGA